MREIPPFRLVPEALSEEAAALPPFEWADPEIGSRHKLGGAPTYLQGPEVRVCSACRQAMTFYGQLDSINDEFLLADCGMVYVFVCFDCFTAEAFIQSARKLGGVGRRLGRHSRTLAHRTVPLRDRAWPWGSYGASPAKAPSAGRTAR